MRVYQKKWEMGMQLTLQRNSGLCVTGVSHVNQGDCNAIAMNLHNTKNLTSQATEQAIVTLHSQCPASSVSVFFYLVCDLHYDKFNII